MKKEILYKLSKEGLYPSYVELKASGISEEILEKIQFLMKIQLKYSGKHIFLKQKIGLYILIMI